MAYSLGWQPDPPKLSGAKPDWEAESWLPLAAPPAAASGAHLVHTILNQGRLGSCVTNAGLQAIRADLVRQGVLNAELGSRLFCYYVSRASHGAEKVDAGTYNRTFFEMASKLGFPPESAWPYNESVLPDGRPAFAAMPPANAFRLAYDQRRPFAYRRIHATGDARVAAVQRCIADNRLVVFGTQVGRAMMRTDGLELLDPPSMDEWLGGHAMCFSEYDAQGLTVVNSWGFDYGHDGTCRFSYDYLTADITRDLWVVDLAPEPTKETA